MLFRSILHLLNSSHIQRKIEQGPNLQELAQSRRGNTREIIGELYLTILSRRPTLDELRTVAEYSESKTDKREVFVDLAWSLINSTEFLYRH